MKKLTKQTKKEIEVYINKNQPKIDWYNSGIDRAAVKNILENGTDQYIDDLYENNMDYIFELEDYLIKEIIEQYPEHNEEEIRSHAQVFICVDMNIKGLLRQIPDIVCLAYVYSNYDCCNSFDTMEPEGYLYEVYQRVKYAIDEKDYLHEFYNGAYGGSLFCFAFRTDIQTFLNLQEEAKTGKTITIPKGTQYGFFSSFQGAGSVFEKSTTTDMTLPLNEADLSEYDNIRLIADADQRYSINDVYGQDNFIDNQNIIINQ